MSAEHDHFASTGGSVEGYKHIRGGATGEKWNMVLRCTLRKRGSVQEEIQEEHYLKGAPGGRVKASDGLGFGDLLPPKVTQALHRLCENRPRGEVRLIERGATFIEPAVKVQP